jgi:hypothetical protein
MQSRRRNDGLAKPLNQEGVVISCTHPRFVLRAATLAMSLFAIVGIVHAGIRVKEAVCKLGIQTWQICERQGEICMADSKYDSGPFTKWYLSAPTIKDDKGRFLGCDPAGKEPRLALSHVGGPHCKWAFEIDSQVKQPNSRFRDQRAAPGPVGYTLKLKMGQPPTAARPTLRQAYRNARGPYRPARAAPCRRRRRARDRAGTSSSPP